MDITGLKKAILPLVDPEMSEKFLKTLNAFIENLQEKDLKNNLHYSYQDIYRKIYVNFLNQQNEELRFFLRYSVLEDLISGENIEKVSNLDISDGSAEELEYPVYYADEWLSLVNSDEIPSSAGDDLSKMKKTQTPAEKLKDFLEKHSTEKRNLEKIVVLRQNYITSIHQYWKNILMSIVTKDELETASFGDKVKNDSDIAKMLELLPKLMAVNQRVSGLLNQISSAVKAIDSLKSDVSEEDLAKIQQEESTLIVEEYKSVKQMYKMCVGRQGNEFPILIDQFMPFSFLDRKKVIELIKKVHYLDPDIFYRKFLGIDSNNPPFCLLAPVYGKQGVCWEAIPKVNRETGRGKIAIPIYPSVDEDQIVIRGLGDYRWQKMKEIAGFRWMNEGLTGHYYEYHENMKAEKKKGKPVQFNPDLKESFIENYILWIKFESQGMQKLDKDVRKIFWLYMPFPDEVKEVLKDRGFHYKQLYENDQRKAVSQGY